jgi:G3E family GTPase
LRPFADGREHAWPAFNLARVMEKEPDFLDTDAEHKHDTTVTSFCVRSDAPVVKAALERWISSLLTDLGNGEARAAPHRAAPRRASLTLNTPNPPDRPVPLQGHPQRERL